MQNSKVCRLLWTTGQIREASGGNTRPCKPNRYTGHWSPSYGKCTSKVQRCLYRPRSISTNRLSGILPKALNLDRKLLEDRIQALLARAVDSTDPAEVESVLNELRASLKEHIQQLREMAAAKDSGVVPKKKQQGDRNK